MAVMLSKTRMVPAPSEPALVAAARAGDDRAFEQLYFRYRDRILGFIRSRVHDHGRAEDITQEVFISALRRLRANDQEIAFKPWIYEIAKNACIDEFRRGTRAREVSTEFEGDAVIESPTTLSVVPGPVAGSVPARTAAASSAIASSVGLRRRRTSRRETRPAVLVGTNRELAMPLRSCGSSDSAARDVIRLISRCTSHWMTSASSTTRRTWSSRCTGPARNSLVSVAARPSCDRSQTSRQDTPGTFPQLPISVAGAWSGPNTDTRTSPCTPNLHHRTPDTLSLREDRRPAALGQDIRTGAGR